MLKCCSSQPFCRVCEQSGGMHKLEIMDYSRLNNLIQGKQVYSIIFYVSRFCMYEQNRRVFINPTKPNVSWLIVLTSGEILDEFGEPFGNSHKYPPEAVKSHVNLAIDNFIGQVQKKSGAEEFIKNISERVIRVDNVKNLVHFNTSELVRSHILC